MNTILTQSTPNPEAEKIKDRIREAMDRWSKAYDATCDPDCSWLHHVIERDAQSILDGEPFHESEFGQY